MAVPAAIALGLSVLPKIPELWGAVAGMFGKETPTCVKTAGDLVNTVTSAFKKGQVPPEKQLELQMAIMIHEERIEQEITKRRQMELEEVQHQRETQVALWESDQKSSSLFVQETRPRILRQMWSFLMFYCVFAPVLAIDALFLFQLNTAMLVISLLKSLGGWLLGTFTTGFIGYQTARTIDKRNPNLKEKDNLVGKALNLIL